MTEFVLYARRRIFAPGFHLWRRQPVWLAFGAILLATFLASPPQGAASSAFVAQSLLETAPFLLFAVLIAAYINATDAEGLIARAFSGSAALMILLAAVAGGISPLCSCGVIPLMAALLRMGVPLSAVMAFCLASPVMDPSMFALTAGILGAEFASAKTLAAIGIGLLGGFATYGFERAGQLRNVLRGSFAGGCNAGGCSPALPGQQAVWRFWRQPERIGRFRDQSVATGMFLARWLTLAFLLESLMLAYVPAELVTGLVGGGGTTPIFVATLVGAPTYMNGYASLPLIAGLMQQGMSPGSAMSFIVAGSITSLPAAMAVWALARPHVFALFLALALLGSFAAGLLYQIWSVL